MQTAWGMNSESGAVWSSNDLATAFHEDRDGGQKIYLLIGRLMFDSHDHLDLLEVIYRILSYGFEGQYRLDPDGRRKHHTVRKRIHDEIVAQRGPMPDALPPGVQAIVAGKRMSYYEFPAWISAVVLLLILLGMFGYYKYQLLKQCDRVHEQIGAIADMTPPPPAPASLPARRLEVIGKGDADPISDNHSSPGRAKNRRVEVTVAPSSSS